MTLAPGSHQILAIQHRAAHAGVWLEVGEHHALVPLVFMSMSMTTIRGGAHFKVGWAAHIRGGCTGRHFG